MYIRVPSDSIWIPDIVLYDKYVQSIQNEATKPSATIWQLNDMLKFVFDEKIHR